MSKEIILKWFDALDIKKEWRESVESSALGFTPSDSNDKPSTAMGCLLECLFRCERLSELYREKEIPEEILLDTLSDVKVWADNYFVTDGEIGIDEWDWLTNHLSGRLYKLGRLQFCMSEAHESVGSISKGDRILEVHIPQGSPMDIELCIASVREAESFFGKYYPEHDYKHFICHSWLFDYELKGFLNKDSNILRFMDMFEIVSYNESDQALRYLFTLNPVKDKMSRLQGAVQKHTENGGKLHEGYGILKPL